MNYPRAGAIAIVLATGIIVSISAVMSAAAQSQQTVVVQRGSEVETISYKPGSAASSKGVVVVSGKPANRRSASKEPLTLLGGDKIWFVDRENDRLETCRLWKTSYTDGWFIRCWSRRLPY